jgi:hypothetical protein
MQATEIFKDETGEVYDWVTKNLDNGETYNNSLTIGIKCAKQGLIAGLIYEVDNSVAYLSIYTISPRWCSKKNLSKICDLAFKGLRVKSLKCLTSHKNKKINKLLWGLKFREEGHLRFARANGTHLKVFAIEEKELKNKWWYK